MKGHIWESDLLIQWEQVHNWKWKEDDQFPPIQYVLTAALYTEMYKPLLERLKMPVPVTNLTISDEKTYVTLDTASSLISDDDFQTAKYDPFL